MKIDIVCVENYQTELAWLCRHHEKHLQMKRKRQGVYILQGGLEVYYMTQRRFETWKLGRTYMHLVDYLMGNDLFYHSGERISKEQLRSLFEGERSCFNCGQKYCTSKRVRDKFCNYWIKEEGETE